MPTEDFRDASAGCAGDVDAAKDSRHVRARKSVLDSRSLSMAIQAAYDLPPSIDVRLYRISGSDVYRVTDDERAWFLKVYRSTTYDAERALASVRALDLLHEHGFSVPQPVHTRRSDSLVELQAVEGPRIAYMYEAAEGKESFDETRAAHGYRFGETAARLHQLMDEVAAPEQFRAIDYDYLFGRYLRGVERLLGAEDASIRFLRDLARALWLELHERLPKSAPQFGFCHGDMHRENVVLTETDQLFFLDFDACGYGWRVMDIGTYYVSYDWMGLDDESRAKRREVRAHFLKGYNAVRQVTEEEIETLDLFMAIRHFELLGIGIYRVPFSGAHWVTGEQLHATTDWFRAWLRGCTWFGDDLSSFSEA